MSPAERLDRLEAAVAQLAASTIGLPTERRGTALHQICADFWAAREAEAAAEAAADVHGRRYHLDRVARP